MIRRTSMTRRCALTLGALLGVMMTVTGCAPTGKDLFERAMQVNSIAKEAVAELQLSLFDGVWESSTYGERPESCGADGYRFTFSRAKVGSSEDRWRLPQGTPRATADDVMGWLDEHGWSGIVFRSYVGGVTDVTITARKPEVYVDDLLVTISPGENLDAVALNITTTCEPGHQRDLMNLMFPNGLQGGTTPQWEHPSAVPFFGMAPDSPTPGPRPDPVTYPEATPTPSPTPSPTPWSSPTP